MVKHKFEDYRNLIYKLAIKGHARLLASGAGVEFDDVFQQMSETFCIASDKFDADKGIAFSTYLVRAVWFQFNRWADPQIEFGRMNVSAEILAVGENDESSFYEITDSGAQSPEQIVGEFEDAMKTYRGMSRKARKLVRELVVPTIATQEAFKAHVAHLEHGRNIGASTRRVPNDINFAFLYDHLNVPVRQRGNLKREIGAAFGVELL